MVHLQAEEIWSYLPHKTGDDPESVMFNEIPSQPHIARDDAFMDKWDRIHALREDVQKALEIARTAKLIGGSLDAKVTLFATGDQLAFTPPWKYPSRTRSTMRTRISARAS